MSDHPTDLPAHLAVARQHILDAVDILTDLAARTVSPVNDDEMRGGHPVVRGGHLHEGYRLGAGPGRRVTG
jgi:hypothetical protein